LKRLGGHLFSFSLFAFLFGLLTFSSSIVYAETKIPELTSPVIDDAHVLSVEEVARLDQLVRSFQPLLQMEIWTVKTTNDEPIENLSIRATDKWKLGQAKKDNGVLLLVAVDDRRMRIEIGRGLEGDVPDVLAGRIVDAIARPQFRNGDYFSGLTQSAVAIYKKAGGQDIDLPQPIHQRPINNGNFPMLLFFLVMVVVLFLRFIFRLFGFGGGFGGGPGYWGGGGGGWGSGGGWGGGSGGGWSGGGGGFSGGGASGSW
jgi:uncharacterized protein